MSLNKNLYEHYEDYTALRLSLGYSKKVQYPVIEFIRFCENNYPSSHDITKLMFNDWLKQRHFHKNASQADAITRIRMYLRYMQSVSNSKVFIPDKDYSVRVERFLPFIFNDEELHRLFSTIDSIPTTGKSPCREYIVPVLFRMMYCCGLRPSEPMAILVKDFDLKNGEIFIRQSKNLRDRRIIISHDLLELCRKYTSYISPQKYFFERNPGEKIQVCWMQSQFKKAWDLSKLPNRGNPRPYDLRHNYATRAIIKWMNEGKEISALMPFLSAYLGHKTLESTMYYIHLVPEHLLNCKGVDWTRLSSVYQEVQK